MKNVLVASGLWWLLVSLAMLPGSVHAAPTKAPTGNDCVLRWNMVALQAVVEDHSGTFGPPIHGGPTRASRALAIVHIAIFDAVNAIDGSYERYIPVTSPTEGASMDAAVAKAAHETLASLYPNQKTVFDRELELALEQIPEGRGRNRGVQVGWEAAFNILMDRDRDGSKDGETPFYPGTNSPPLPGQHQPDPINSGQGLLGAGWGQVATFSEIDVTDSDVRTPPPPALDSEEYAAAFVDVLALGGDGVNTPTLRTKEETEIGLFWAYDGTKGLGVPPVLYNQAVRALAKQERNTPIENARLLALVNLAMADAGIASWDSKYYYNVWRPIIGIRNADRDENPATERFANWMPLGAPASNQSGINFTPPFPAYPSGHATFGAAAFGILRHFYGTDEIAFHLSSDELSGRTTDSEGKHHYKVIRRFDSFTQAELENARSRIYLGIHWQFDAEAGVNQGRTIANYVFNNLMQHIP